MCVTACEGRSSVSDSDALERQIEERLAVAKAKYGLYRGHFRERMEEMDREQQRRDEIASRASKLVQTILRPRLTKLISYFDNAQLADPTPAGDNCCTCVFSHNQRFPATTKLELGARSDPDEGTIYITYCLEILPMFFDFDREDRFVTPADAVDEQAVATWAEKKILQFLDAYLRLQEIEPYQQENLVTDPVCGMRFNKNSAAGEAEYRGTRFYFCVEECRLKFLEDPSVFVKNTD